MEWRPKDWEGIKYQCVDKFFEDNHYEQQMTLPEFSEIIADAILESLKKQLSSCKTTNGTWVFIPEKEKNEGK